MGLVLLILFVGLPIAEIMLLIEVGGVIGGWPTVGLCIATGIVGAGLARAQGTMVFVSVQRRLASLELPTRELVDALLIVVAGAVLVTPGFITDALGLLLLLPPTRAMARRWLMASYASRVERRQHRAAQGGVFFYSGSFHGDPRQGRPHHGGDASSVRVEPEVELLPPGTGPSPPKAPRPTIIDAD